MLEKGGSTGSHLSRSNDRFNILLKILSRNLLGEHWIQRILREALGFSFLQKFCLRQVSSPIAPENSTFRAFAEDLRLTTKPPVFL